VLLPINSPVDRALGLPQRSKVLAAASACLEAVRVLHKVRCAPRARLRGQRWRGAAALLSDTRSCL
jgi:hypothetical protein